MPDNETLRTLRELAGLTQEEAAEAFGLHPVTWRKREAGAYPIPGGFIGRVKVAFKPRIRERASVIVGEEVAVAP